MAILNEEATATRDAEAGSAGRGLPAFPWESGDNFAESTRHCQALQAIASRQDDEMLCSDDPAQPITQEPPLTSQQSPPVPARSNAAHAIRLWFDWSTKASGFSVDRPSAGRQVAARHRPGKRCRGRPQSAAAVADSNPEPRRRRSRARDRAPQRLVERPQSS